MVEVEYLSIAEFAEKAGVSKQAIYKQVGNENSQIAPYLLRDGKRTLIKVSALRELYKVDTENLTFTTPTEDAGQPEATPKGESKVERTTRQPYINPRKSTHFNRLHRVFESPSSRVESRERRSRKAVKCYHSRERQYNKRPIRTVSTISTASRTDSGQSTYYNRTTAVSNGKSRRGHSRDYTRRGSPGSRTDPGKEEKRLLG